MPVSVPCGSAARVMFAGMYAKEEEGAWRMPWLTEAMKDVISCDKLRLGANDP